MAPLKVIIVGGGLAGACLANGLINKADGQIDVTVFERDEAGSERGGYQIRLGAHALIGFKACLTKDQYSALLPCFGKSGGVVSSAPCIFSPSDLKVLIDLSKAPVYEKSAPIARTRLRNFLQKPLQERDAIRFGKKETARRVYRYIGSATNIQHNKKQERRWTLPRQLLEKGTIYTGNSKAKVFAAVYLPECLSSTKKTANSDDSDILKPKNYDEDEASLFLGMAWTTGPEAAELPQVKDKKGLMKKKLDEAGFHPDFHKLVDAVDEEEIMTTPWRYARNDTPVDWRQQLLSTNEKKSDPSIANPRVWLIGDSIHPMLPSRGMGANNAIHDTADALGPLLELAKLKNMYGSVTDEEVGDQLAVYEKAMVPRAFKWVKKSSNQQLPDLDSLIGRGIIIGLRVMLFVVGGFVSCLRMFGWEPKDDAPELS
uniref:FAD-binding domain-containing protein n=1 Tax=Fusarium oxysporum (strain Fo5176) TaxID=660025 RepID=A0A0D2YHI1_FUSOF